MSAIPSDALTTEFFNLITTGALTVGLYTSNPGPTNTGDEVTGGGYSRQTITFGAPSSGTIANDTAVEFDNMPTATITHYAVFIDNDFKYYGKLSSPAELESGFDYRLPVGQVQITFSGE